LPSAGIGVWGTRAGREGEGPGRLERWGSSATRGRGMRPGMIRLAGRPDESVRYIQAGRRTFFFERWGKGGGRATRNSGGCRPRQTGGWGKAEVPRCGARLLPMP